MQVNALKNDGPLYRCVVGTTARIQPFVTVAALNRGDFVINSSGSVDQACALPGSASTDTPSGGATVTIGRALHAAAIGDTVQVALHDDNIEWFLRIYNDTASAAEQADITVGTAYQFTRYRGVGATSADAFYCLFTTTTNGELRVTEKSPESASGDDYGWVYAKGVSAYRFIP